jgi:hypothetical protein
MLDSALSADRRSPVSAFAFGPVAPHSELAPAALLDSHPGEPDVLTIDVTGNGRLDLVQLWTGRDGGLHATTHLALPGGALSGGGYRRAGDDLLGAFGAQYEVLPCDLDGDGRTDLLVAYADGPGRELRLAAFLSHGSGFDHRGDFATGIAWSPKHLAFFAIDVDGDGRADLVEAFARTDAGRGELLTFRTYLSCFDVRADVRADVRDDVREEIFSEAVVSRTAEPAHPGQVLGFWPVDLNGDGATDLVRVRRRGDGRVVAEAYLAERPAPGQATFAAAVASDLGNAARANPTAFFLTDADGDGIADLVQVWTEGSAAGPRLRQRFFFGDAAGRFVAGPPCGSLGEIPGSPCPRRDHEILATPRRRFGRPHPAARRPACHRPAQNRCRRGPQD